MNRLEQIEAACVAVEQNRVTPNWGQVFLSVEQTRDLLALARAAEALQWTEPVDDTSVSGWERVCLADTGRLEALTRALASLQREAQP